MMGVHVLPGARAPRFGGWAITRPVWLIAAVAGILVVMSGAAWMVWRAGDAGSETRPVLLDVGEMTARFTPLPVERAGLDSAAAIARGRESLSAAAAASATTRFGQFSLQRANDSYFMEPRPVWLVTYEGVPFVAQEGCSCAKPGTTATTMVIDGRDGRVLTLFGPLD